MKTLLCLILSQLFIIVSAFSSENHSTEHNAKVALNPEDVLANPDNISITLHVGVQQSVKLMIENNAISNIEWGVVETDTPEIIGESIFKQDQTPDQAIIGSDFLVNDDAGFYAADNFILNNQETIDGFIFDGFILNEGNFTDSITGFTVFVYEDAEGIPIGHPEDGGGTELFSLTIPVGNENLDLGDGDGVVQFNIVGFNDEGLNLPEGTYWVSAFPQFINEDVLQRWAWNTGVPNDETLAQFIDPQDWWGLGYIDWTDVVTVANGNSLHSGLAFSVVEILNCGAEWLNIDLDHGILPSGEVQNLNIMIDTTNMSFGEHKTAICFEIDGNSDELVTVPVYLRVNSNDLIFANSFE